MYNEITLDPAQVAELITLAHKCNTLGDINTARDIYAAGTENGRGKPDIWTHSCALSYILRIGYIMGQRAERAKRAAK